MGLESIRRSDAEVEEWYSKGSESMRVVRSSCLRWL